MKVVTVLIVFAMATLSNTHYSCPHFWHLFGGNCYRYLGERLTWAAAEARCNDFSTNAGMGHLTSVLTPEENGFLYELFRSCTDDTPSWVYDKVNRYPFYGVWTGLHQAVLDGPWVNTDGSDQGNYFHWKSGEPNNMYYRGEQIEDCVHIWRYSDVADTNQDWNDLYCDEVMAFICKMPAEDKCEL